MLRAVGRVWTMSGPGNDSGHIQDCQNRHDAIATIGVVESISLIVHIELTEGIGLFQSKGCPGWTEGLCVG